jgi:hypothetical protein
MKTDVKTNVEGYGLWTPENKIQAPPTPPMPPTPPQTTSGEPVYGPRYGTETQVHAESIPFKEPPAVFERMNTAQPPSLLERLPRTTRAADEWERKHGGQG